MRVRCERSAKCPNPGFCLECAEWFATCRVCAERLSADEHHEALAWAHGHMHVRHPGWHLQWCEHELQAHAASGRSWCLDCGQDVA